MTDDEVVLVLNVSTVEVVILEGGVALLAELRRANRVAKRGVFIALEIVAKLAAATLRTEVTTALSTSIP